MGYLPMRVLNLLRGIALFDINSVTGALEMRAASSSSFWLEGAYHEPVRAGLYLSPVAPSIPVAAGDGRSFSLAGSFNFALKVVVDVFKRLPADYSRFASDPAALCSDADREEVERYMAVDISGGTSPIDSFVNLAKTMRMVVDKSANCVQVYVRDAQGGVQSYDIEPFGILMHMADEYGNVPGHPDQRFRAMTSREWDHGVTNSIHSRLQD